MVVWCNAAYAVRDYFSMNKLKEHRLRCTLTQQELADQVGVQRETIVRIENNKQEPSLRVAMRIAAALDVTVADIWNYDNFERKDELC